MKVGNCNGCDGTRHKWSGGGLTIHFGNPHTLWEGAEQPYIIVTKALRLWAAEAHQLTFTAKSIRALARRSLPATA